jgi:hypothetical protein
MSATYNATLKNTRMTDVVTAIGTAGYLNFYSSVPTLLASLPLANPAGTVTGGVLTFTVPMTDTTADASGTAASASVSTAIDGGGTVVISGLTVSSTVGDIVLSSTNIVAGQPVTVTAASITHG